MGGATGTPLVPCPGRTGESDSPSAGQAFGFTRRPVAADRGDREPDLDPARLPKRARGVRHPIRKVREVTRALPARRINLAARAWTCSSARPPGRAPQARSPTGGRRPPRPGRSSASSSFRCSPANAPRPGRRAARASPAASAPPARPATSGISIVSRCLRALPAARSVAAVRERVQGLLASWPEFVFEPF